MTATDNEFLNEYKHLDKICSEMYSCSSGVSEYISEMEENRSQGIRCVFGWERDYQNLKHMRWLRNQLVHDEYPEECTKEDVETAKHFYERMFSQQDPLAQLHQALEKKMPRVSASKNVIENAPVSTNEKKGKTDLVVDVIFLAVSLALAITRINEGKMVWWFMMAIWLVKTVIDVVKRIKKTKGK